MSMVTSKDIGPLQWSYMAAVMAKKLGLLIGSGQVHDGDIPRGVYWSAVEFLKSALQGAEASIGKMIADGEDAYMVASEAFRKGMSPQDLKNRDKFGECLESFLSFVTRLQDPHKFTGEEIEVATRLKELFEQLDRDGEREAYRRVVADDSPELAKRTFFKW